MIQFDASLYSTVGGGSSTGPVDPARWHFVLFVVGVEHVVCAGLGKH